jgi:hypothetical protein
MESGRLDGWHSHKNDRRAQLVRNDLIQNKFLSITGYWFS